MKFPLVTLHIDSTSLKTRSVGLSSLASAEHCGKSSFVKTLCEKCILEQYITFQAQQYNRYPADIFQLLIYI